jgi:hypothetical protein
LHPTESQLLNVVRNQIIGSVTGEALDLCGWQIGA